MSDKIKKIHIGLFSVSKTQDISILESEEYALLAKNLQEKHGIYIHVPKNLSLTIEAHSPIARAEQIHTLFCDDSIDVLWALTGGSASNEILEYLDYELIQKNKKPVFGYSDVTILLNALYQKSHCINFLSPNVKTLLKGHPGTLETFLYFIDILKNHQRKSIQLESPKEIYDPSVSKSIQIPGIEIIKEGKTHAIGIGGNLSSICLLVNTPYFPSLENKILLLEECSEFSIGIIRRNLFRLRLAEGFQGLQGVIFGHINASCYKDYDYTLGNTLKDTFRDLDIPIIKNTLHGHILPIQTLPIGGEYTIDTLNSHYLTTY